MRFLLVNPKYPISETPSPPLGIAYLAAALEQAGIEVKVLDFVVFPYDKAILAAELKQFAPQFLGVTSVTMTFNHAIQVIEDAKETAPELITLMGGPHATFQAREILSQYPALDLVIRGEGEDTLVDLVSSVGENQPWAGIPGIAYRHNGDIEMTPKRAPVALDSLPLPARHLLPLGRYRALGLPISMTTSRGCPFSCIFCVGRKMAGAKVRYRPPEQVVDELAALDRMGFHQINIADDLFTANPRHCMSVCDEIVRRGLTPSWTAFARVDTVSPEILSAMQKAGCHTISFGVESGNPDMLRRIKKGITLEQVTRAATMCREAGIAAQASFILGLPGETPDTLADTLAFGKKLKALGVLYGFHLLAPFPGTDIWDNQHQYDIQILSRDWDTYHANRAVTETASVKRRQMDDIAMEWEEDFLTRLGEIKQERAAGSATPEDAWILTKLEHTVRIYDWMMAKAIEKKGTWPASDTSLTPHDAICTLAARLDGSDRENRELIQGTLKYASDNGNLDYETNRGNLRWAWTNFLKEN